MRSVPYMVSILILAMGALNVSQAASAGSADEVQAADQALERSVVMPSAPTEASDVISRSQALRRRLNLTGIAAIEGANDPNTDTGLTEYVRLLGALQLPRPKAAAETAAAPVVSAEFESPATSRNVSKTEPNQPSVTQADGRKLNALLDDPAGVVHAFAAAEALYRAGDHPRAAAFYRIALERMSGQENAEPGHVAWTLFQLANCLRIGDPAAAAGFYERLATEYPNSRWTAAAAVQRKLIAWYGVHRPDQLLETYTRDPNSL